MTVGDYINTVRAKLSDAVAPYRFSAADISASLREALRRARQIRPSLCYKDGALVSEAADVDFSAAVSTVVRVELDPYAEALAFLAASRILINDNADTLNLAVSEKWKSAALEILAI
jgi:hypothetical protein